MEANEVLREECMSKNKIKYGVRFVCPTCGTNYNSNSEEPPPGITWSDGHTCSPEKIEEKSDDKKVEPNDSGRKEDGEVRD